MRPRGRYSVGDAKKLLQSILDDERLSLAGKINLYGGRLLPLFLAPIVAKPILVELFGGADLTVWKAHLHLGSPALGDYLAIFIAAVVYPSYWLLCAWGFSDSYRGRRSGGGRRR